MKRNISAGFSRDVHPWQRWFVLLVALLCPTTTAGFSSARSNALRVTRASATTTRTGAGNDVGPSRHSTRSRLLKKVGLSRLFRKKDEAEIESAKSQQTFNISTVAELDAYFEDGDRKFRDEKGQIESDKLLRALKVIGDTQIIGAKDRPEYVHPVTKLVHERKREGSKCTEGARPDGCKVALVVEGGGMRGCISAGMICAVHHLGLRDTIDVVYGASAGSLIGAYFVTEQLPWFGPELYYDKLTTAGKEFIDTSRLLRSLGIGLVDPRLLKDVVTRPSNGKPVLSLPFLLGTVMQETKPLDWEYFERRQKVQPLKIVASGLKSEKPFLMDYEHGDFKTLDELSKCMHASCLLPGIAGPVMNFRKTSSDDSKPKFVAANNLNDADYEPLGDALVYAPIPFSEAKDEGATHMIVLRSRPDGTDVTGNGGIFERLISRRYFLRKNRLPKIFKRLASHLHKKLYAEKVIELNDAAYSTKDYRDPSSPHILTVALPPGSEEIGRLEVGREAIFDGVRRGFARAYDALVDDPAERGRGDVVARQYFPDEIMDYDPRTIDRVDNAAFSIYLEENNISPKQVQQ